jgi:hypothetical protein
VLLPASVVSRYADQGWVYMGRVQLAPYRSRGALTAQLPLPRPPYESGVVPEGDGAFNSTAEDIQASMEDMGIVPITTPDPAPGQPRSPPAATPSPAAAAAAAPNATTVAASPAPASPSPSLPAGAIKVSIQRATRAGDVYSKT